MPGAMLDLSTVSPLTLETLFPGSDEVDSTTPPYGCLALGARIAALADRDRARAEILDSLIAVVGAERAFLVRSIPDRDEWDVLTARSFEGEEILNPTDKIIPLLLSPCQQRGEGYFARDLEKEPVFDQLRRARLPRTRSVLILPLPDPRTLIYLDHRFQELELSPGRTLELGWLYTVLVATESMRAQTGRVEILEDEVRDLRRRLKSRSKSGAAPPESTSAAAEPPDRDPRGLRGDFHSIVGQSPQILEILKLLERVAPSSAPILVNGESGTGKELIAKAIHANSARPQGPFVSENCGALTETLLESELFGYMRGAFTGAYADREGLFEVANGGTLFLDEIGDTSPGMQKKLLRVLQEGQIRRVGGSDVIPVDVRVVSATNKDLMAEVRAGRFREDLFYRLNVINVVVPPLRDRAEDIPLLVEFMVNGLNAETGETKSTTPELIEAMSAYSWPGNIRELQNEVRRVYTLSEDRLEPALLSRRVQQPGLSSFEGQTLTLDSVLSRGSLKEATEEIERQILAASLKRFHGNKVLICSKLKIPKTTLYNKLKRYGLESDLSQ